MSGVHTAMTNTLNTPIEALERAFPMRVRRYRLRRDSGGAGAHPGGDGIERDLEVLERRDGVAHHRAPDEPAPWGLAGGEPGAVGENWLLPGGDESRAERLPDKCTVHLARRRRAAHAHPGRRRLGTSRLTSATTSGAASLMAGWNSRNVAVTVSTWSAPSSMRRRPLVMRCNRSATNRASR